MEAADDVKQHIHYSVPEKPLYPSDNYNGVNQANTQSSPFSPHSAVYLSSTNTTVTSTRHQTLFHSVFRRERRLCVRCFSWNESIVVIQEEYIYIKWILIAVLMRSYWYWLLIAALREICTWVIIASEKHKLKKKSQFLLHLPLCIWQRLSSKFNHYVIQYLFSGNQIHNLFSFNLIVIWETTETIKSYWNSMFLYNNLHNLQVLFKRRFQFIFRFTLPFKSLGVGKSFQCLFFNKKNQV